MNYRVICKNRITYRKKIRDDKRYKELKKLYDKLSETYIVLSNSYSNLADENFRLRNFLNHLKEFTLDLERRVRKEASYFENF